MQFQAANSDEFQQIRDFYWNLIDAMHLNLLHSKRRLFIFHTAFDKVRHKFLQNRAMMQPEGISCLIKSPVSPGTDRKS